MALGAIPAYSTLPRGFSPDTAESLPFVVFPHGGPHARDFRRFHWSAQMLANAGYGVLQMNFRGYGVAFETAGRNWGGLMIDDVIDGAQWLVWSPKKRICSFCGYAAMMSVAREPERFSLRGQP